MKVYGLPDELPAPELSFANGFDWQAYDAACTAHKARVADWLRAQGYTGPATGKTYSTPMADGQAVYMIGDAPRKACLIHLPYGDGWHSRDVEHLPKKVVLERAAQQERVKSMFAKA